MNATVAAIHPIVNLERPDFIGDFFNTLLFIKPIIKNDKAVNIMEHIRR